MPHPLQPVGHARAQDVADVGRQAARQPVADLPALARRPGALPRASWPSLFAPTSTPTSGSSPTRGRPPPWPGASTTAPAGCGSSATARATGSSPASPAPTSTPTSPSPASSPPASTASSTSSTRATPFVGNAYDDPDVEHIPSTLVEAIDLFRELRGGQGGVRRRRAPPPPQHRRAGVGRLQPGRHRLGAPPQLRAALTRPHPKRARTHERSRSSGHRAPPLRPPAGRPPDGLGCGHDRSSTDPRARTRRRGAARRHRGAPRRGHRLAGRAGLQPRLQRRRPRARGAASSRSALRYLHDNALNPFKYPSVLQMELDVIAMAASCSAPSPTPGR